MRCMPFMQLIALAALASAGCSGGGDLAELPAAEQAGETSAPSDPVPVHVTTVEQRTTALPVVATGTAEPLRAANIGPEMTSRIQQIYVQEGDHVEEGAPLVRLEAVEARLRAAQAQASASAAEAQAQLAESELSRLGPLAERGTITPQRRQQLEAQSTALRSSAEAARAAAAQARRIASQAVIRAPFAGLVSNVRVEVGEVVTMVPATIMLRLVDLSGIEVHVRVHEGDLPRLAVGDTVQARFPAAGRTETGQVTFISPEIDEGTRTAEVVARVDNSDGSLRAGLFVELSIEPQAAGVSLVVPESAVIAAGDERVAFVVQDDHAARRVVTVEPFGEGTLRVLAGLHEGDRIATDRLESLADGAPIRVEQGEAADHPQARGGDEQQGEGADHPQARAGDEP